MQKTRKLISMLLAVLMVLSMCTVGMVSAYALPENAVINDTEGSDASSIDGELYGLMGDSDANGKINVKDATQIQKFAAKLIELDETSEALSDVDLNGKVNVKDATAIQKWVAKIAVDAPINCLVYIPTEPTTVATEPTTEPTVIVVPTTAASEDEPTTAASEDESVPVIIPTTVVTEPTEATTVATEPTEATTTATEPTEATTEATEATTVTTEATTAAPVIPQTIRIYFTNTQGWELVNVHYWGDGASEWPGVSMTYVETNDMGQDIYSAEVPAGITGAVFNCHSETVGGDNNQTVDVTEGFADNAGFYPAEQDPETTKWIVGTYTYIPKEDPTETTTVAPETQPTETTTVAADTEPTEATTAAPETLGAGYYLVGIIDGEECWDADTLTADRKFKENPDVAGDYVLYFTTVGGDEYKVAYFDGTAITELFKAEGEPNYKIGVTSDKIGYCKIDFNPEGHSYWSYTYFTVKTTTPPETQPTEGPGTQPTVAPESKPQLEKSEYELRGSFNDWNGEFMYKTDDADVVTLTLELAEGTYTFKVKNDSTWYGNGGTIEDTTTKTSQGGWTMDSSAGDCTLKATGGFYTFNFNTSTKKLIILHSTEPVTEPTEATTAAPETSTAAPETSTAAPETSTAAPETSTAAPETSTAAPETSTAAPETSTAAPETSTAAPETSTAAPETSTAAPETSTAAPETSTAAPETEPTETTTEAAGLKAGYYLVGTLNDVNLWGSDDITADRELKESSTAGEYTLNWTFIEGDEIKVVYYDGEKIAKWYNDGGDNYGIGAAKAGYCTIYFRPDGNDNWSYYYFTVQPTTAPDTEPTEATTVAPETSTAAPETSTAAPETSTAAPETSTAAPETSTAAPETEPTTPDVETVIITFDATKTTWVSSSGAKLVLVDNGTNTEYPMTGSGNVYTVEVPVTVTNITFNRNDPSTNKPWNFWVAGDRADAVKYNTVGDGAGSWEGTAAPEWYVRGSFNSWGTANPMKTTDGVTYTCEIALATGNYEFKVGNVDWSSAYPGSNKALNVTTAGTYVFTFNASSKTVSVALK